jgi:16S rRNA (cytosine1402-N4)-methyltransferase
MVVNDELGHLQRLLENSLSILSPGGRLAIISFHSIEDRVVKHFMKTAARSCICPPEIPECRCEHPATVRLITRSPIVPTDEEIANNPRSRSAKLRIIQKL